MIPVGEVATVILAAGAGSRFGGGKIRAPLDGRPLLAHVLAAVREAGVGRVVVVLGRDAEAVISAVREAEPAALDRVLIAVNPEPERGLATTLALGFGPAAAAPTPAGVLIILGDQPRVRADVLRTLCDAVTPTGAVAVVPRYDADAAPNPVLLLPAGWPLVARLTGDRGLSRLLDEDPARVVRVPVRGANPDVDTPADLAAMAEHAAEPGVIARAPGRGADELIAVWAARVRANREQAERIREVPESGDFYGPITGLFVADPRRTDDPVLNLLMAIARPGEKWLDIGAGAGRFALPLALRAGEVIALDPSVGMLQALRDGMERHSIRNVRPIHARWPMDAGASPTPRADVVLIAHLGHDVEAIAAFLDAMEGAARRLCVAVMTERAPSASIGPFWPVVHGEPHVELPAFGEFLAILEARGRDPSVIFERRHRRVFDSRPALLAWLRNQLFVAPGSAADERLEAELERRMVVANDGSVCLVPGIESRVGIASWEAGP